MLLFANIDAQPAPEPEPAHAALDNGGVPNPDNEATLALQKVELDIDDAPFLTEDEEEQPAPTEEAPLQADAQPAAKPRTTITLDRRKLLLIGGLLALVVVGLALWFFVFRGSPSKPDQAAPQPQVEEKAPEAAAPKQEEHGAKKPAVAVPPPPPQELTIEMAPFWIEKADAENKLHFVQFQFSLITTSTKLRDDVLDKNNLLRDAIVYYFGHRDYAFLSDTKNIDTLKADIVQVLNQYLGTDQFKTLYIQTFLVK